MSLLTKIRFFLRHHLCCKYHKDLLDNQRLALIEEYSIKDYREEHVFKNFVWSANQKECITCTRCGESNDYLINNNKGCQYSPEKLVKRLGITAGNYVSQDDLNRYLNK